MPSSTQTNDKALVPTGQNVLAPAGEYVMCFPVQLDSMTTAAADLMTSFVLLHPGVIKSMSSVVTTLGTGSGATQALSLTLNGVAVTGGVLTQTLANATPLGNKVDATAITALNAFNALDTLSIKVAASGTVFTAGRVNLLITIQNTAG